MASSARTLRSRVPSSCGVDGRTVVVDDPPLPPLPPKYQLQEPLPHPVSLAMVFEEVSRRVVPPTLTTLGETAGQVVPAPESPEAATKVTPGVVNTESQLVSPGTSLTPQLMETVEAPVRVAAYLTALSKSVGLPVASTVSEAASVLAVTPGAAKVALHRARRRLIDALVSEAVLARPAAFCAAFHDTYERDGLEPAIVHARDCAACVRRAEGSALAMALHARR